MPEPKVVSKLCDFLTQLSYEDLGEEHQNRLHELVIDVLACGFGGVGESQHVAVLDIIDENAGSDTVTMLGTTNGAPVDEGALANATAAHILTLDDRHGSSSSHPGSIVVPAGLAVGEATNASGKAVLVAILAGYETIGKLGKVRHGFNMDLPRRPTPVFGPIGAAVTAGLLYDLDATELQHAMGYAANLSGGLSQVWVDGTEEYALHNGFAARQGVSAARLAARGLTAAPNSFEGQYGFYRAFFGAVPEELADIPRTLGGSFELDDVICKPLPACGVSVVPIRLTEQLLARGISATDVERIDLTVASLIAAIPGTTSYGPIETPSQALMSIPFGVASTLVLEGYSWDACRNHTGDAAIETTMETVHIEYDDSFYKYEYEMRVQLTDGSTVTLKADTQASLTRADIEEKFRTYATGLMSPAAVDEQLETLRDFAGVSDISAIMANMRTSQE